MKFSGLACLLVVTVVLLCTVSAEAVINRTGQAFGGYGSGNTTIDQSSFPGGQLGPNDGTGYFGVTSATIDIGGQGQIAESIGVLSASAGFDAASDRPADPRSFTLSSGGGATLVHTIDVSSNTLPLFTPVQVRFEIGVGYVLGATSSFGTPGSANNNAFASASAQVNVTGLSSMFLSANDNKAILNTEDGTDLAVGLFAGNQETDFVINSEVGGSITFALVVDADTNGDVAGNDNPLLNRTAQAYSSVAAAYGAEAANGEDIQLTVTGPAGNFPDLTTDKQATASTNLPLNPFAPLAGDLDGDGFVGIDDLNLVLSNWNQNVPPADPLADPSGDGFVGIDDLNTVLGNWNAGTPPGESGSVPEPTTAMVMGLGAALAFTRIARG